MKLHSIIKGNHWFSVEATLINLYPDEIESMDTYKEVFDKILLLEAEENDIFLVLTQEFEDETGEPSFVDVYGKSIKEECGLALEFTSWNKWLGMNIYEQTLKEFNELEIIAHCLYEMTFIDFDETEIQNQFLNIKDIIDEYNSMTDQEKEAKTTSLDELLKDNEFN
ncbi:MAG TPA: DUF6557 family protein [Gillisia sp.]|nr:DUF6557 family protein [Gillisia sp.]